MSSHVIATFYPTPGTEEYRSNWERTFGAPAKVRSILSKLNGRRFTESALVEYLGDRAEVLFSDLTWPEISAIGFENGWLIRENELIHVSVTT